MTGYQKNSYSIFLIHEGRILLRSIGNRMVSPSMFSSGGMFEDDNLSYIKHKLLSTYSITVDDLDNLRLRYITLRWVEGELRQNFIYFAEAKNDLGVPPIGNDKWIPFEQVLKMEMPKTIHGVLTHYLDVGRSNDRVYCGVVKQKGVAISELEEF